MFRRNARADKNMRANFDDEAEIPGLLFFNRYYNIKRAGLLHVRNDITSSITH